MLFEMYVCFYTNYQLLDSTLGGSSTSGRRIQGPRSSLVGCVCGAGVSDVGSEF